MKKGQKGYKLQTVFIQILYIYELTDYFIKPCQTEKYFFNKFNKNYINHWLLLTVICLLT